MAVIWQTHIFRTRYPCCLWVFTHNLSFILHGDVPQHLRNQLVFTENNNRPVPVANTPSSVCGWYVVNLLWPQEHILSPTLSNRFSEAMQQPSGDDVQLLFGVTFWFMTSFHTITNSSYQLVFVSILHTLTYLPMPWPRCMGSWIVLQPFVPLHSVLCLPPWDHRKSSHSLRHKLLDIPDFLIPTAKYIFF